jgi:hypothetical protein
MHALNLLFLSMFVAAEMAAQSPPRDTTVAATSGLSQPPVVPSLPVTIDDLRRSPCGDSTLGELLARWLRATPEQRPELERMLRTAGPLAAAIAYHDIEPDRTDATQLLELLTRLPLPDDQPTERLQTWRFDARLGAAANAVLMHWSAQCAGEWQGLLASDSSSRYLDLAGLGAKAHAVLPALLREVCEPGNPDHSWAPQQALVAITGPHIDRAVWLRELRETSFERRVLAITMLAAKPGRVDAATVAELLGDTQPRIARLARDLLADSGPQMSKYDNHLDLLAALPDARLQANAADRWLVLGRRELAIEVLRRLAADETGRAHLYERAELLAIAVENGWLAAPLRPARAPVPGPTDVAAMLQDPQRRELGWQLVRTMSMRDFDPTIFPAPPTDVLAAWLDLDPERVRNLVAELATAPPGRQAEIGGLLPYVSFDAGQLAAVVASWPRAANGRLLCSQVFWWLEPLLRLADPVLAARLRIERRMGHSQHLLDCPPVTGTPPSVEPFDAGLTQVLDEFLRSEQAEQAAIAIGILAEMGSSAGACVMTLLERLPAMTPELLPLVRAIFISADASSLPALCLRLLDDPRPEVRRVALWIEPPPPQPLPANELLARRVLAAVIADHQASNWFVHLQGGNAWLPHLTEALRAQPTHVALAQTIAGFGAAARDALQAAAAAGNSVATAELAKLLQATAAEQRRLVEAWLDPEDPDHELAANWLLRPDVELSDPTARGTLLAALPKLAPTRREAIERVLVMPAAEGPDTDALALAVAGRPTSVNHHRPERWQRLWRLAAPSQRQAVLLAASRAVPRRGEPHPGLIEAMLAQVEQAHDPEPLLHELVRHGVTCPRIEALARDEHRSWNRGQRQPIWASRSLAGRIQAWAENPIVDRREVFARTLRRDPTATARTAVGMLDSSRATQAFEVLRWLGPAAATVLPELTERLRDPSPGMRCLALQALVAIHGGLEPALAGLQSRFGAQLETVLADDCACVEAYQLLEACRPGAGLELAARELRARRGAALAWIGVDPAVASRLSGELRTILRGEDRSLQAYVLHLIAAAGPGMATLLPEIDAVAAVPMCHAQARTAQRAIRGLPPRGR